MNNSTKRRKLLGKFALSATSAGVAAVCAGLATYALFSTSSSSTGSAGSGTLVLALGSPGANNRLAVSASNIAPGDTIQRAFTLTNTGSLDLDASPVLTTSATVSSALDTDATYGLQMVIQKCSTAWTESGAAPAYTYTCGGTTSTVLASRAVIGSSIALSNISELVTAGGAANLRLTLTFPTSAGNSFQGLSSTINYSFSAGQRSAVSQ